MENEKTTITTEKREENINDYGLYTTEEVATRLELSSRRISQHANTHNLGVKVGKKGKVFTEEHISLIASRKGCFGKPKSTSNN